MLDVDGGGVLHCQFQSAPGREAGRCSGRLILSLLSRKFQSAPGREAGRCALLVSITGRRACFNPRPAVRPGDASCAPPMSSAYSVSIRARP